MKKLVLTSEVAEMAVNIGQNTENREDERLSRIRFYKA